MLELKKLSNGTKKLINQYRQKMNTIQTSLGQKISFVATAFRPNNWMETYNNINQNDISF